MYTYAINFRHHAIYLLRPDGAVFEVLTGDDAYFFLHNAHMVDACRHDDLPMWFDANDCMVRSYLPKGQ